MLFKLLINLLLDIISPSKSSVLIVLSSILSLVVLETLFSVSFFCTTILLNLIAPLPISRTKPIVKIKVKIKKLLKIKK